MRILTLHCDYIKFKAVKKAIKNPEELSEERKKEINVKDPLVILTAVEKGDNEKILKEMIASVKKTAGEVKANKLVLYPYAHLSSNLSDPETALKYLTEAEQILEKEGFEVTRAPFGYYKEFELKCKGHPLSELSKEFRSEVSGITSTSQSVKGANINMIKDDVFKEEDISKLLKEISRSKLDTSKLKENDHRILGQKLDLFSFNEASPGSVFWHPKGQILFTELVNFSKELQKELGYQEVSTPQIYDNKLWRVSGHWGKYKENMFLTEYEGKPAALKPMNCPGHYLYFRTKTRSYKDLPLRISEYSPLHRMELSGVLNGLFRVIRLHQDDAHIFIREDQIESEVLNVLDIFEKFLKKFGFTYTFTLSLRSEEKKSQYLGSDELWKSAEESLANILKKKKIKFERMEGEAKFYGPSLDVQIKDSLGREWQCSTLQLDFNAAKRFELEYMGEDGKSHTPLILHRAVFGSLERFIGILIEHYNGALPVWLSPVQVRVINFTDRNNKAAEKIVENIRKEISNLRIDSDFRNTTVSDKVRDAEMQKIPYVIVIGDKEEEKKTLAVRRRGDKKPEFDVKIDKFIKELKDKIEGKL